MSRQAIKIEKWPELDRPFLILGFDGWGNALNISRGVAKYLVKRLNGQSFARLDSDLFYRYDQARPTIKIKNGVLQNFHAPQGVFLPYQWTAMGMT